MSDSKFLQHDVLALQEHSADMLRSLGQTDWKYTIGLNMADFRSVQFQAFESFEVAGTNSDHTANLHPKDFAHEIRRRRMWILAGSISSINFITITPETWSMHMHVYTQQPLICAYFTIILIKNKLEYIRWSP